MHILFVDDDIELKIAPIITELKKRKLNFSYDTAKSMATAALYIKETKPDLIVLDLGLPSFDNEPVTDKNFGLQLIRDIKNNNQKCPVIIYSTSSLPENFIKNHTKHGMKIEHIDKTNPFVISNRIIF